MILWKKYNSRTFSSSILPLQLDSRLRKINNGKLDEARIIYELEWRERSITGRIKSVESTHTGMPLINGRIDREREGI